MASFHLLIICKCLTECVVDEIGSIEFWKDTAMSQVHLCPFLSSLDVNSAAKTQVGEIT